MLTQWIGSKTEKQACRYLQQQGLTLVTQNYRCRFGEIDLIMRDGPTWVCVEVKFRSNKDHGRASEMVDFRKIKRMKAAFQSFLLDNGLNPTSLALRLDVVAMEPNSINWVRNI